MSGEAALEGQPTTALPPDLEPWLCCALWLRKLSDASNRCPSAWWEHLPASGCLLTPVCAPWGLIQVTSSS